MPKIRIYSADRYPDWDFFDVSDDTPLAPVHEVSDATLDRWIAVLDAYEQMQKELARLVKETDS